MLMEMAWRVKTVLLYTRIGRAMLAERLLQNPQLFRHDRLPPTPFIRGFDFGQKGFHTLTRSPLDVLRSVFVDKSAGKQSPSIPLNETIANKGIAKKDIPPIDSVWDTAANADN
jgi:hypothetical protein